MPDVLNSNIGLGVSVIIVIFHLLRVTVHKTFLSPHADRHAGGISFTVCLFVCLFVRRILVTDISGVGWRTAMKFSRVVDLAIHQDTALDGRYPGATSWPGSREARVTNWRPLAVTAIGMWGFRTTGVLVSV